MARIWLGVAIALIAACARPVWAWAGKVTYVTDGDTVWVLPARGGPPVKIRLHGMDAPEICQAGGVAARVALAQRVSGRTVVVSPRRRDRYGRTVARLHLGGEDIAGWMVGQGQAWSGGPYPALQTQAQAARRGLFADPAPVPPRVFRQRHGPCHA